MRHAEKAHVLSISSPPLSPVGEKQAEKLLQLVQQEKLPFPQRICCSPQVRSRQTLQNLAKTLPLEMTELSDLDERRNSENYDQFRTRVKKLLEKIASTEKTTYLCTHLDWIEEALTLIPSDSDLTSATYQHWGSGQYMIFQLEPHQPWQLEEFGRLQP